MSLTLDTVKHLQKDVLLAAIQSEVNAVEKVSSLVVVPDGFKLQDMESFKEFKDDFRFNYSTSCIPDFAEYCQEFDQDGAKCFIAQSSMCANVIFDIGTQEKPLFQRNKASLQLDKTAAYSAILNINEVPLSQKQASEFIEDWTDQISVYDQSGELMSNAQAAKSLREITIDQINTRESKVGNYSESMSASEKIEARNQEKLPSDIVFVCQPYTGLDDRAFTLRASLLAGGDKPRIVLRIVKLEKHVEDMASEFKDIVVNCFKENEIKTFIGSC